MIKCNRTARLGAVIAVLWGLLDSRIELVQPKDVVCRILSFCHALEMSVGRMED